MSRTAAAPSVRGDELPAVTVPNRRSKTGGSAARASIEVSRRTRLSLGHRALVPRRQRAPRTSRRPGGRRRWPRRRRGGWRSAIAVLLLARDPVLLGHLLGRLPHGQAGGRLGDGRRLGHEVARPDRARRPARGPPTLRAREASTSARAIRRLWRMGTSERLSAPPAIPTCACPARISDGHLRDGLVGRGAGAVHGVGGHRRAEGPRAARPRAPGSGPSPTGSPGPWPRCPPRPASTSARSTSSRTQAVARSTAVRSRKTVPAFAKGVRQPAAMATRPPAAGVLAVTPSRILPPRNGGRAALESRRPSLPDIAKSGMKRRSAAPRRRPRPGDRRLRRRTARPRPTSAAPRRACGRSVRPAWSTSPRAGSAWRPPRRWRRTASTT